MKKYLHQIKCWLNNLNIDNFDQITFDQKIDDILESSDDELLIELFRGCSLEKNGVF